MESNINFKEISTYSQTFSNSVCDRFFESRSSISGEEILKLTPIHQVNLFVIYELLRAWKEETEKLKSPYFNYDSSEVQDALKKLMNTLSKHIEITRTDFEPLLNSAVEKALLLIFSPYQFYKNEIDKTGEARVKVSQLEELKKYVKINQNLLLRYLETLQAESIEEIFSDDAIRIFDDVCQNIQESPDDFESYIPAFSTISPLNINLFYQEGEDDKTDEQETEQIQKELRQEVTNLNEALHKDFETLADVHEKKLIDGIKKNITINQRFMFVNELFEGNADEFESVVNFLDNCEKKNDALGFIQVNCIEGKGWDQNAEEVQEFIQIVRKRFPEG